MDFIGNQLIKVILIPDPEYEVKTQQNEIMQKDLSNVYKQVVNIVKQETPIERIVYISVDEWKKNNYNFASKIILDLNLGN